METYYYKSIATPQHSKERDACCGLTIIEGEKMPVVILTELAENEGTSITNCYEKIATELYKGRLSHYLPTEIQWVEHYNKNSYNTNDKLEETFDLVSLQWDEQKRCYLSPAWTRCQDQTMIKQFKKSVIKEPERVWIIQRCIDAFKDQYENWMGYSEDKMTRDEMAAALRECMTKWPMYEFRGHNTSPKREKGAEINVYK